MIKRIRKVPATDEPPSDDVQSDVSARLRELRRCPWGKKRQTLKIETRVPPQTRTKAFATTGCVCLHLRVPFSHHHGTKNPTASASGRDVRHPTELHGCAHGGRRSAHEADCASNTCLQKGRKKKCSRSSSSRRTCWNERISAAL